MATAISATPTGNQYIDGVLYGTKWSGRITYSFADTLGDFGTYSHTITGFQQISATQQNAIQSILNGSVVSGTAMFRYGSFSQISNVDIGLAADPNGASDLMIGQATNFDGSRLGTARVADFPRLDQRSDGGDVWFGDYYNYRAPEVGTYEWMTHIHEFGHALGLSHGHNAGTSIVGFEYAIPHDRDGMEFSVMTYRSYVGALGLYVSNETYGYVQTLMMYDIAAIQHLYGANFNTNNTNTVYTFNATTGEMSVNGVGQGAPGTGLGGSSNRVLLTIWDGGGTDTYDFHNYNGNMLVDLAPGGYSLVSQVQRADLGEGAYANGNVYNALQYNSDARSLIENAIGGSGNDEIAGNAANNSLTGNDGADVLIGRAGNDTLDGGIGDDTLYGDFRSPAVAYTGTGLFTESTNTNNTFATARSLDAAIGAHTDANLDHSDTNPSVMITATGDGSADWFSFDVKAPGQIILDVDGTMNSYLVLYDANGTQLAYNDNSVADGGDNGAQTQSYITYTVATPGRYYVKVIQSGSSGIGVNVAYKLGIVVPQPVDGTTAGSGNDRLFGGAGLDKLYGGAGNDLLDGGTGADQLFGGTGDDTYVLGAENDSVTDTAGIDTISSTISRNLGAYATIENLQLLGTANISGMGNALANKIYGNAGNNILDGQGGADTLYGYAGNDTYVLGASTDGVVDTAGNDTITSTISRNLGSYAAIENLILLGNANINGIGNALANRIYGNAGNNILDGQGGADILYGYAGNDTYVLGNSTDGVVDTAGIDTITSTISRNLASYAAIENLTLTGLAAVNGYGNGLANTITGNGAANSLDGAGGNDRVLGGAGNDRINGGLGNDILTGGTGLDTFIFNTAPNRLSNVDQITDFSLADDTIALENAIFTAFRAAGAITSAMFTSNLTGVATAVTQHLIYEKDTGKLFYDSNGSASGGSVQIALLKPNLGLTFHDFVII